MMVRFINKLTGHDMWVADDRIEEYKAAGHKPAVSVAEEPTEEPEIVQEAEQPEDAEPVATSQQEEKAPAKKAAPKKTAKK